MTLLYSRLFFATLVLFTLICIPAVSAGEFSHFSGIPQTLNDGGMVLPKLSPVLITDENGGSVWSVYNDNQQSALVLKKDGRIVVTSANGSFGFHLAGIGRPDALRVPVPGTFQPDRTRLEIIRPGYTEWYISRDAGIEQGMNIAARPEGNGMLTVSWALSGDLQPRLTGQDLILFDPHGPAMRYSGLAAYDSRGRALPSTMSLSEDRLTWTIDDREAVYPVTIDPVVATEDAILSADDGAANAYFGVSVSVNNDTAFIGAYRATTSAGAGAGKTYVFTRSGSAWSQTAKLNASDTASNNNFGNSVCVYNDTAIIGAPGFNSNRGKAYIFTRYGSFWNETAILTPSDPAANNNFGTSVYIYNDTAVIGANGFSSYQGKAYIFTRSGSAWTQTAALTASDGGTQHQFGSAVALDNDTAMIGAPRYNPGSGSMWGKTYIYTRSGSSWPQTATLTPSDTASGAWFGTSVSLSGDSAAVGASGANTSGKAYVFTRSGSSWTQTANLDASDTPAYSNFGKSISVNNTLLVVGASSGKAYVFSRSGTSWTQKTTLKASDSTGGDYGYSVSIDNRTVVVGADGLTSSAGKAYVYSLVTSSDSPVVKGITPSTGSDSTTTSVTVTGSDFNTTTTPTIRLSRTGYANVLMTGVVAESATLLGGTVPAGMTLGAWNVTVINPDGQQGTNASVTFTVISTTPTPTPVPVYDGGDSTSDRKSGTNGQVSTTSVNVGQVGHTSITHVAITGTGVSTVVVTSQEASGPGEGLTPPPGIVYEYADITPAHYTTISSTQIDFHVEEAWLNEHHLTAQDIILYHSDGKTWTALPTTLVRVQDGVAYYSATSPGFSRFAITGQFNNNVANVTASTTPKTLGDLAPASGTISPTYTTPAVAPVTVRTTAVPVAQPVSGFPVPTLLIAGALGVICICGVFLVRRWWIQRQNPALFRKDD